MAWNKLLPTGATKICDSDDQIRLNNAAIETVLGTNITAGPTTIQGAIQGDTTKGRKFRGITLVIDNGTNGVSLKCTVASIWNGDTIAETDDITKGATVGNFSLSAGGTNLTIEAAGLSGNCVHAMGSIEKNLSGTTALTVLCQPYSNDIRIVFRDAGVDQDMTTLVDTGLIDLHICYVTDA